MFCLDYQTLIKGKVVVGFLWWRCLGLLLILKINKTCFSPEGKNPMVCPKVML